MFDELNTDEPLPDDDKFSRPILPPSRRSRIGDVVAVMKPGVWYTGVLVEWDGWSGVVRLGDGTKKPT